MSESNYRVYEVSIPAGAAITAHMSGNFLRVITAAAAFEVAFDGNGSHNRIEQGLQVHVAGGFQEISLYNPTGAALDVTLGVSTGGIDDSRLSLPGTLTVTPTRATGFADGADVALVAGVATLILAASASRHQAVVTNITGADIRIGGATVAAARGTPVANNGTMVIDGGGAVYGFSAGGGNVAVSEVTA